MKKLLTCLICLIILFFSLREPVSRAIASRPAWSSHTTDIQTPIMKWQLGGCYSSWCETGWYSSPAVADLDRDGAMEVIGSPYTIFVLDGTDGTVKWHIASGHDRSEPNASNVGRTWASIVIADVDQDGNPEIVTAHSGGYISAYDRFGYFKPGWPQHPINEEFRSLAVADLDGDGQMEIVAGRAKLDSQNLWVFDSDGGLHTGWPQLNSEEGSAAGIYNDNIAIGDLIPGGDLEITAPSDTITIAAYNPDGSQIPTNPVYHDHPGHDMLSWSDVPAYVQLEYEIQGWGPCYEQSTARANFADGPANIVDVDGDGVNEVVAIGNVHDCHTSPYTDLYFTPFIFNADRSRFIANPFDWSMPPVETGAPIQENYNVIETAEPNPVTVDLDGDGQVEILYASYDGKMHAFWLDKAEHGNWPYAVYQPADPYYSFASEPAVADLNGDGTPEVLFASWTQKGSHATGNLYIVDNLGNPLQIVHLPMSFGSPDWNGSLAAPTLADIDQDGEMEVVLNTAHSGLVAYDLPGTKNAQIYWGTGRGNYQRTGSIPPGSLDGSDIDVNLISPEPGDLITYTITLRNPGMMLSNVMVVDALPAGLGYAGNATCTSGVLIQENQIVTWAGSVPTGKPVVITFQVLVDDQISNPLLIRNLIQIDNGFGEVIEREADIIVNSYRLFSPIAFK
jgi:uncharacterized repeat protein (TIGR01451 family)